MNSSGPKLEKEIPVGFSEGLWGGGVGCSLGEFMMVPADVIVVHTQIDGRKSCPFGPTLPLFSLASPV